MRSSNWPRSPTLSAQLKLGLASMRNRRWLAPRIDNDRQIFHRRLDQLFRTVTRRRVEKQRIAGFKQIGPVGVTISHFSRQHVDELDADMPEIGVGERILLERDEKGLDADIAGKGMAEQIVEMPGFGAPPLDPHPLPASYTRT